MSEDQNRRKTILHRAFEIGIFLKGFDGVLEILGGLLLLYLNPARMDALVQKLTQHELSEDPNDIFANFLLSLAQHFSVSGQIFASIYLLIHGVVKVGIIVALWQRVWWAYPIAILVFVLFGAYQIYQSIYHPGLFLIFLTLLDIAVIYLTWWEWQRHKG
ncbi:DUF2127 domain-containing protein [Candidatus Acetothermia bacterium]|nr:DUF2127 domain-containing protein [Candidatus Acetothermia bacterium]MBI3644335.1 DUF2127 domain-containing protein [Candidatus Acetothermia bacterium]